MRSPLAHPDEEQIQRLVDGELSSHAEQSVREHLTTCPECRRRVAEAERDAEDVKALLHALDHPAPPIRAEEVAASAARQRDSAWMRQAAAVLLAAGIAGAAYAVPGSPVRTWVGAVAEWMGARQEGPSSKVPPTGQAPERISGIAVSPGQKLLISFTHWQPDGEVRVSLSDGADVVVRAPAGAATFSSSADQLVIDNGGAAGPGSAADFEVQIPRAAPWVEILVDGKRIFLKYGPRVTAAVHVGAGGGYTLPLVPLAP